MFQKDIVAPIVLTETCEVRLTTPWFVEDSEYPPALASYRPLVNGEEAFAAVHHAIAQAKKSVDIICWGFQPSMYFIRDGKSPCIGELLCQIAEKGVQVRILGWEMPFNTAGFAGEANLPGKGAIRFRDRAGQSASEEQYAFDKKWFRKYAYTGEPADMILGNISIVGEAAQNYMRNTKLRASSPLFVSRGFNQYERAEIAYRLAREATDQEISGAAISTMTFSATHHQKTVLVDYELPEHAVGFVMGHNMIDEYWDTDAHSAQNRRADSAPAPNKGARGFLPRQDISCQVTGPILEHLHHNFALSWLRETRQNLFLLRNAKENAKKLKLQEGYGKPLMAQLLRTQAQEEKRDIEKLYLQSVNNATRFIYIENQYFRWPPLAEAIKKAALAQMKNGRTPERDGSLYLFVTTNVTDDGIGAGTVNTQRMLDALGQGGAIPEIHKLRRVKQLQEELERERDAALLNEPCIALNPWDPAAIEKVKERGAEIKRKLDNYQKEIDEIMATEEKDYSTFNREIPGLKVHICSLVAQDSPAENWMPVYIHSKLMIIDDVFTTHGSANINTRSMQVDSEMNIAHEYASVTKALRQRLWKLHTNGMGVQDNPAEAFDAWEDILKRNHDNQYGGERKAPEAPLIRFYYDKPTLKDMD